MVTIDPMVAEEKTLEHVHCDDVGRAVTIYVVSSTLAKVFQDLRIYKLHKGMLYCDIRFKYRKKVINGNKLMIENG